MNKTIYTLELGGNAITLKFTNGALRKFKVLTGKDPIDCLTGDTIDRIDFAENIIKAGMQQNDPNADISKVGELIDEAGIDTVTQVINAFGAAFRGPQEATPEGGDNTQP
jgi:hypothetical protein